MSMTPQLELSDDQFIGYCELHCQTPRALFSGRHVNRMLKLAGNPPHFSKQVADDEFLSLHESMAELCTLARARIAANSCTTTPTPDFTKITVTRQQLISLAMHLKIVGDSIVKHTELRPGQMTGALDTASTHADIAAKALADLIKLPLPGTTK